MPTDDSLSSFFIRPPGVDGLFVVPSFLLAHLSIFRLTFYLQALGRPTPMQNWSVQAAKSQLASVMSGGKLQVIFGGEIAGISTETVLAITQAQVWDSGAIL